MAAQYWNPHPYSPPFSQNAYIHPFGNPIPDFARDNRKQLAVKVEHEGSCRRFSSAYVNGYGLDLDIIKLRRMIFKLFDLNQGSSFTMSYSDSDNEWITFSSDEELRDAVHHQCLNPLRVRIAMNVSAPDPLIEDYISKKAEAIRIGETRPSAAAAAIEHNIPASLESDFHRAWLESEKAKATRTGETSVAAAIEHNIPAAQKTDCVPAWVDVKPAETDETSKFAADFSESLYHNNLGVSRLRTAQQLPRADYSGAQKAERQLDWKTRMDMRQVLEVLGFYDDKLNKHVLKSFD